MNNGSRCRNKSTFPPSAFLRDLVCLGPDLRTHPRGHPSRRGSWMLPTHPVEFSILLVHIASKCLYYNLLLRELCSLIMKDVDMVWDGRWSVGKPNV